MAFFPRILVFEQGLGVSGKFDKGYGLVHVGLVGAAVPFYIPLAQFLLLSPLARNFLEESHIHQSVELIDVHDMNAFVEALVFRFQALDSVFVFVPHVRMAGVQGIPAYPRIAFPSFPRAHACDGMMLDHPGAYRNNRCSGSKYIFVS